MACRIRYVLDITMRPFGSFREPSIDIKSFSIYNAPDVEFQTGREVTLQEAVDFRQFVLWPALSYPSAGTALSADLSSKKLVPVRDQGRSARMLTELRRNRKYLLFF